MVPCLRQYSYEKRPSALNLTTLAERRLGGDLIQFYKTLSGINWLKVPTHMARKSLRRNDSTTILVKPSEEKLLSSRDVTKYFNIVDQLSWSRFDEYVDHIGTLHYVNFSKK